MEEVDCTSCATPLSTRAIPHLGSIERFVKSDLKFSRYEEDFEASEGDEDDEEEEDEEDAAAASAADAAPAPVPAPAPASTADEPIAGNIYLLPLSRPSFP